VIPVTTVEQSIDVAVPVRTAYNQWTQFEEFPRFMDSVERIDQRTPTRTHWVTKIAGVQREFDAEISEQIPDERIAWHALDGPTQSGVVTFHRLDDTHTRVMLQMAFEPEGVAEQAGDKLGVVKNRVHHDLEHFKDFIEHEGQETGAWRGHVNTPGTAAQGTTASQPGTGTTGAGTTGVQGLPGDVDRTDPLTPYAEGYEPYRDEEF
jgi:uncharacterized membrane protein